MRELTKRELEERTKYRADVNKVRQKHFRRGLKTPRELLASPLIVPPSQQARVKIVKRVNLSQPGRRFLSLEDKKRIVFARFGSLTNFDNPVMSKNEISRKYRVPMTTVCRNLASFELNHHNFEAMGARPPRFTFMPDDLKRDLLKPELL